MAAQPSKWPSFNMPNWLLIIQWATWFLHWQLHWFISWLYKLHYSPDPTCVFTTQGDGLFNNIVIMISTYPCILWRKYFSNILIHSFQLLFPVELFPVEITEHHCERHRMLRMKPSIFRLTQRQNVECRITREDQSGECSSTGSQTLEHHVSFNNIRWMMYV